MRDGDCRGGNKDTLTGEMDRGEKGKRVERDRKERNKEGDRQSGRWAEDGGGT